MSTNNLIHSFARFSRASLALIPACRIVTVAVPETETPRGRKQPANKDATAVKSDRLSLREFFQAGWPSRGDPRGALKIIPFRPGS